MSTISFPVTGTAVTQGSKTLVGGSTRFARMIDRNNMSTKTKPGNRLHDWRELVAGVAASAMHVAGLEMMTGPVRLHCEFYFTRPTSHRLVRGGVRKGSPALPRLDVDKLTRAVGDALSGVVYRDDVQIARIECEKSWTMGASWSRIGVSEL